MVALAAPRADRAHLLFRWRRKINHDWIRGEPMRSWLLERAGNPLVALVVRSRLELLVFSYGGLLFDLLVVPALLWRRTRPFAFAAAVIFHTLNSQLFQIGIFPWMMLAATTLFFDPRWPRTVERLNGATVERRFVPPLARSTVLALSLYVLLQVAIPSGTSPTPATSAGPRKAISSPGT